MKIYMSGLYSGTSPQPGIGIARSLRHAYPHATLVGVEYSNRSSGIHFDGFDEIWLQRGWEELNLDEYGRMVREVLDSGALWISGTDLEALWLADVFPDGHPNLLSPPARALRQVGKPAVPAHQGLPLRIPEFIWTEQSDWDLHAFCRQHGWRVWLKGPYYEAVRTRDWAQFEAVRTLLTRAWSTERLFLQSHVTGYEESVCLCAYKGELLGCVRMRKRELTEEGKTWAGDVTEVPDEISTPLRKIIKDIGWTGGAELEMVRDAEGQLWLLEWNPRFPAWIHGATIAGRNMSALLVEGATGIRALPTPAVTEEFHRIVIEVPVRPEFPLPPLPEPYSNAVGHSLKHPSGMLALAEKLHKIIPSDATGNGNGKGERLNIEPHAPIVPASFIRDLEAQNFDGVETPAWVFMDSTAENLFKRAADLARKLTTHTTEVRNAYSMKTNPDERMVNLARQNGFLAESISLLEVQKAMNCGFQIRRDSAEWSRQVVPGRLDAEDAFTRGVLRFDSRPQARRRGIEDGKLQSKIVGVRLRTPNIPSRFGIPVGTPEDFETLVYAGRHIAARHRLRRSLPYGEQQHRRRSVVASLRINAPLVSLNRAAYEARD
jgi:hypothetical protein